MEYKNKKQLLPIKNKVLSLFLKGFLFLLKNFVYIFLLVLLSQYLLTYAIANTLENDLLIIIVFFAQVLQFFCGTKPNFKKSAKLKRNQRAFNGASKKRSFVSFKNCVSLFKTIDDLYFGIISCFNHMGSYDSTRYLLLFDAFTSACTFADNSAFACKCCQFSNA